VVRIHFIIEMIWCTGLAPSEGLTAVYTHTHTQSERAREREIDRERERLRERWPHVRDLSEGDSHRMRQPDCVKGHFNRDAPPSKSLSFVTMVPEKDTSPSGYFPRDSPPSDGLFLLPHAYFGLTQTPQQSHPLSPLHEPLHWRAKRDPKA